MTMLLSAFVDALGQGTQTSEPGGEVFVVWLLLLAGIGAIGASMAKKRFRPPWVGFVLGFFLGLIGLIVIAVMGQKAGPGCMACGAPLQLTWVGRQAVPARVCLACGANQRETGQPVSSGPPSAPLAPPSVPPPPVPVG
jgi:Zn ribbon nucleic-acid-binding protein